MHLATPSPPAGAGPISGIAAVSAHQRQEPSELFRLPVVERITGLKRSSIYAGMRARTFPLAVKISARAVAWRAADVFAWCESREQAGEPVEEAAK